MNATQGGQEHPAGPGGHEHGAAAAQSPPGAAQHPPRPVPVTHHKTEPVITMGAAFGSWFTYTLAAATPVQLIAPHDERRARMLIIVQSASGTVWVGSKAQAQASPVLGGNLPPGTYELKNQQELWLAPDGAHAATVTTLIERNEGTR